MRDAQPDGLGRRGLALVAFAAVVTMMSRLWEGDLFRDEVLYAAVAKQILVRHEWLNLYLGNDPYWNKPPLLFWLAAAAYRVGGITTFTAKVFPALFGVGSCVALYLLARRLTGERIARPAGAHARRRGVEPRDGGLHARLRERDLRLAPPWHSRCHSGAPLTDAGAGT
jgi:4-amino-4-deoxy-L-arabinose transferase-like glycosyltransferase